MNNVFAELPLSPMPAEQLLELLAQPGLRIERIVSTGQSSPPGVQPARFLVRTSAG